MGIDESVDDRGESDRGGVTEASDNDDGSSDDIEDSWGGRIVSFEKLCLEELGSGDSLASNVEVCVTVTVSCNNGGGACADGEISGGGGGGGLGECVCKTEE